MTQRTRIDRGYRENNITERDRTAEWSEPRHRTLVRMSPLSFGLCGGDLAGVGIDDLGGGLVLLRPRASPSMPLRKSTGRVASKTRTAPEGPITSRPSRHRSPPRSRPRRHRGRPAPRRHPPRARHRPHPSGADALVSPGPSPPFVGRRRSVGRHDDRHEQRPLGGTGRRGTRQPPPGKQLPGGEAVTARDAADRVLARVAFRHNRGLLGRRETAPATRAGEHVEAPRRLRHGCKP